MKTYHLTMSDGTACDVRGESASEAMAKALYRHRGLTVSRCFAGNHILTDHQAGRTEYDVPPHKAIPDDVPDADEDGAQ